MKVNFDDIEFGCFEPHRDIEYKGKTYRVIDVMATLDSGNPIFHTIAEKSLENDIAKSNGCSVDDINDELDDSISYYADNNDGVYYVLEQIVGEEIN